LVKYFNSSLSTILYCFVDLEGDVCVVGDVVLDAEDEIGDGTQRVSFDEVAINGSVACDTFGVDLIGGVFGIEEAVVGCLFVRFC
jgi:hypothetical protein